MQFSNARFRLALYPRLAAIVTTLILMDINLVIAVMFRLLAARSWLSRAQSLAGSAAVARYCTRSPLTCVPLFRSGTSFCATGTATADRLFADSG